MRNSKFPGCVVLKETLNFAALLVTFWHSLAKRAKHQCCAVTGNVFNFQVIIQLAILGTRSSSQAVICKDPLCPIKSEMLISPDLTHRKGR